MLWLTSVVALQLLISCRAAPTSSNSPSGRSSSDGRPSETSGESSGEVPISQATRGRKRPTPPPPVLTHGAEPLQMAPSPRFEVHPLKRLSMGSASQVPPTPYQTLMDDPTKIFDVTSPGKIHPNSPAQHGPGPTSQLLSVVPYPSHPPLPLTAWLKAAPTGVYADWWLEYRAAHNGPLPDIFRISRGSGMVDFIREEYHRYAARVLALDELRK
ncbi:uncharacterized protein UTRI_04875 [Ustilago trichophora]|uniref:Uncharacterized protein n=1 Tax=Ustilago trichophora TaxID=86804 RepID=A0A5C3EDF3_9BASI|nr:uncharacterized protein UTRI_04875 [Ustilago trichophora]